MIIGFHAFAEGVLRDPRLLQGWTEDPVEYETMIRLRKARIVHLNHDLLRRDFPEALAGLSNAAIEERVLACAEFISLPQAARNGTNTEPHLAADQEGKPARVRAFRPVGYGRAVVYRCFGGLIDVKGAGSRTAPAPGEYSTGLFSLANALREELMERTVALIFEREGYSPGTVRTYGEIDLGFNIILDSGKQIPAGALLRQAHGRLDPLGRSGVEGERVERILRKYGLISSQILPIESFHPLSLHNAQLASNGALFDFETICRFSNFRDSPVTPNPELSLPASTWNEFKIQIWAEDLARKTRAKKLTSDQIEAELKNWLQPLTGIWSSCERHLK